MSKVLQRAVQCRATIADRRFEHRVHEPLTAQECALDVIAAGKVRRAVIEREASTRRCARAC